MRSSQRSCFALIPARGGSKGIPAKNLALVGGRPLVVRSIHHALETPGIDEVWVSTDDDEIARVSRRAGARVIERPSTLAADHCSTESAIEHAFEKWSERGAPPEVVVLLQCTSPFREAGQLQAAIDHFHLSRCDSLLSVTGFHGFVWQGSRPLNYDPGARPRRQDIADMRRETGSFYVFSRESFARSGSRLSGRIETFDVPETDALDIDEPRDLVRARTQARRREAALRAEHADLGLLVLDVDGTLTDAAMFYGEDGSEMKRFDTRDGVAVRRWQEAGGVVAMITGEQSRAAARRAEKLGIAHVVLGCSDKRTALCEIQAGLGLGPEATVAMGDDINDLSMRSRACLFVAPASAHSEVLAVADLVTERAGGHGAVRELVDRLMLLGAPVPVGRSLKAVAS